MVFRPRLLTVFACLLILPVKLVYTLSNPYIVFVMNLASVFHHYPTIILKWGLWYPPKKMTILKFLGIQSKTQAFSLVK